MAGLSGTTTTAQTTAVQLDTNLATSNLSARKGDANYSDVQWWLEWYTDTGATAANATIAVTYNDSSTGNLNTVAIGGTVRASRMIGLNSLIPTASAGKYIMRVNSVTATTTGAVGSYGITATRYRAALYHPIAAQRFSATWAELGLPEIYNSSCLFPIVIAGTTSTGAIRGTGKILHG